MGVAEEQLRQFKGKKLEVFTKADIVELRGVYNAIKEGETTVAEVFGPQPDDADGEPPTSGTAATKEALAKRRVEEPEPEG